MTAGDARAGQILQSWFSPAYPVGAFAYSHGLEAAMVRGEVTSADGLFAWIEGVVTAGAGRTDAVLLAAAYRAGDGAAVTALADALAASAERRRESLEQGRAFAATTAAVWGITVDPAPYPVAVGAAARALWLPLLPTLTAYLQAFAANLVSAAVRFLPLGQTEGQQVTARLFPTVARVAAEAGRAGLDDIGTACFAADLAAMEHETLATRIFKT